MTLSLARTLRSLFSGGVTTTIIKIVLESRTTSSGLASRSSQGFSSERSFPPAQSRAGVLQLISYHRTPCKPPNYHTTDDFQAHRCLAHQIHTPTVNSHRLTLPTSIQDRRPSAATIAINGR
jgi:hypothetical protein